MENNEANLKDFIAQTIQDIYLGVNEGKTKVKEPLDSLTERTEIAFDLAVSSSVVSSTEKGGKIGINVLNLINLGIGEDGNKNAKVSQANRIRFTVPLLLREREGITDVKEYTPFDSEAGY